MKLWPSKKREAPVRPEPVDENVLVISDIHLGEDVLAEGPELSDYIRALNHQLAEFIAAHSDERRDGRRWHLIVNGDMFDFVKLSLRPDGAPPPPRGRITGPSPSTPDNIVWKLERILEIHRPLFRAMAVFLVKGNRITIIEGNHDAECYLPQVREALRRGIVALAQRQSRELGEQVAPEVLAERLAFRTWFEASNGRYHVEHGHQYDEFCSFEYNLAPYDDHQRSAVAMPLAHRAIPYFAELLGDFSTHGLDEFTAWRALRMVATLGPRKVWVLTKVYMIAMVELLRRAGQKRRRELNAHAEEHRRELSALAASSPYGLPTLEKLDALKATPAEYSVIKMVRVFYFDVVFVAGALVAALGVAAFVGGLVGLGLAVASLVAGAWSVVRGNQDRRGNLSAALRTAAARIAQVTGARYVVFGHSHKAELVNLREQHEVGRYGETSFYMNSGSWVTREVLRGEHGAGMTFVELTGRGAALKRWLGAGKGARVLAASDEPSAPRTTEPVIDSAPQGA